MANMTDVTRNALEDVEATLLGIHWTWLPLID
jgi:hypothetical protein